MKADVYLSLLLKETDLVDHLRKKYGGKTNKGQKIMFVGTTTQERMEIEIDLKNSIVNVIYHREGQ